MNNAKNEVVVYRARSTFSQLALVAITLAAVFFGFQLKEVPTNLIATVLSNGVVEVKEDVAAARNDVAYVVMTAEEKERLEYKDIAIKSLLQARAVETIAFERALLAKETALKQTEQKLVKANDQVANALVPETTVSEFMGNRVVEPAQSAWRSTSNALEANVVAPAGNLVSKAKNLWNSYEFKPEKITSLIN